MSTDLPAVERLARLTGWTGETYVSTPWDSVQGDLGLELPDDYRQLLSRFPPGSFDGPGFAGDIVLHPPFPIEGRIDYLFQFGAELNELSTWRRDHPEEVVHPVHPEPGGMVPWARAGREALLWVRGSEDPNEWTVGVSNGGIWRYDDDDPVVEEFACGAVDFLIGFVSGSIVSRVLSPETFREPDAAAAAGVVGGFRPMTEDEWKAMIDRSAAENH